MDSLEILIDIRKIVRSINLESKRVFKEFGISIPQLLCLGHIGRSATGQCSHGELMKLLSLNSSTVTGIVNRLEKRALVMRHPDTKDKRITWIEITPQGMEVVNKAPEILHDQLVRKITALPDDIKQKIRESLDIIVQAMHIENIEASPVITINDPIDTPES